MQEISLLELIFSGDKVLSILMSVEFLLAFYVVYLFFYKYFLLKEVYRKDKNFLENIADCIYDNRVDAAIDLCRRVDLPEARMINKGLKNMHKSNEELFILVGNHSEVEMLEIKNNEKIMSSFAIIMLMFSFFNTFVIVIYDFFNEVFLPLQSILLPLSFGMFFGGVFYFFEWILASYISHRIIYLKKKRNKFLEIIADIK